MWMKKQIKKTAVTAIAFAFIVFAVPMTANAQKDIYDVVGATDTISNSDKTAAASKKKNITDKVTDKVETAKTLVNSDTEDTREILKDIRTMMLGILFVCAWTAGAVTYSNFGSTIARKV